ncbi:MAG: adenylate kinase [Candidatus Omnitrophota bacterium]|nr:adenylate kinase [Candidatus Omnitrophota bacterium]MBU1928758.1 adenylate kinase [Candidatus Omnitrophota bacterium]MBU2034213.1 adenylate kinase [Candidatus Omnitrophota bacterium]MBU2221566.1 adenylate kinase [Candidatus Omnitrophota bacterium]
MKIIFLGAPGAGKGTQAKKVAQKMNILHISTGDLLRQNVTNSTSLGRQAKDFMNKGALVPDELVTQMLIDRLSRPDIEKGFILDGYPRNLNQAKKLDEVLADKNRSIDKVIYLDASEPVIIQRITGRLVCRSCGANFHIKNMPPKKNMVCDHCGGELYQRSDDKEETVRKRLEVYRQEAACLIDYYSNTGRLIKIKADDEAEPVLKEIFAVI